jgi:hypothetical protein
MARPPSLTPKVRRALVSAVKLGCTLTAAADAAGLAGDTVLEWIQRGEGRHPTRPSTPELARFAREIRQAQGAAQVTLVRRIHEAAKKPKEWRAALAILERRWPETWGRRDHLEATIDHGPRTAELESEIAALEREIAAAEARVAEAQAADAEVERE